MLEVKPTGHVAIWGRRKWPKWQQSCYWHHFRSIRQVAALSIYCHW